MAMKIGRYGIISDLKKCTPFFSFFGAEEGEYFPALMAIGIGDDVGVCVLLVGHCTRTAGRPSFFSLDRTNATLLSLMKGQPVEPNLCL